MTGYKNRGRKLGRAGARTLAGVESTQPLNIGRM